MTLHEANGIIRMRQQGLWILNVKRVLLTAALSLSAVTAGVAQTGPITVALLTEAGYQPVVSTCQSVAQNQAAGEDGPDGLCVSSTVNYLTNLQTGVLQNIFGVQEQEDAKAGFLAELASLALDDLGCVLRDTEIPEALLEARRFYDDPGQQEALTQIVSSIVNCNITATAAIPPVAPPASPGGG